MKGERSPRRTDDNNYQSKTDITDQPQSTNYSEENATLIHFSCGDDATCSNAFLITASLM